MTLRCYIFAPTTVFAARVNQASFTYPLAEVTFDGVTTGAFGDIEPGMTVLFGTSAGDDDLGRQRIRKAATADTLYIGRSSRGTRDGEVNLQDDAYISVLDDWRIWAKIPRIVVDENNVTTIYKDYEIAVGTKTGAGTPPVGNTGIPMAGTIDAGTGTLEVEVPGENALNNLAVADGASISSYSWTLPSGVTLVTGYALTDQVIRVLADPGFHWLSREVTDSNGNTHTSRVPIYARDPANDTTVAFQIESRNMTITGEEITLRLLEDVDEGTYPDGTFVIIWEDEPDSAPDRDHIVFWGWHDVDGSSISSQRTGLLRDTTFTCVDVGTRLDRLPGFPQSIAGVASPSTWTEMASPNMDKYLHYLLQWHSTALDLADFGWSGTGSAFPFVILGSDGESLWDQVERRARALVPDYHFTCNRRGQLQVIVDPMLQNTGDRTPSVQKTLLESDWTSIRFTHQRHPRVYWHRENAILADASTISALFAVAPGEAPGQGERPNEQGEQLAQSQSDLNACAGHRYARLNAPQSPFNIILAAGDLGNIDPAELQWVNLNMSAATAARRGLAFTSERGLPLEVTVSYDYRREATIKTVELQWERETDGPPAVIDEQETDDLPDDEFEPPDGGYDEDPGGGGLGTGFGALYAMASGTLRKTADFSAASPVYPDIGPGTPTAFYHFVLDPFSPATTGYLATDDGIYKSTDLDTASPTWTQVLSPAAVDTLVGDTWDNLNFTRLTGNIRKENWIAFAANTVAAGNWAIITSDGGDNWNAYQIDTVSAEYGVLAVAQAVTSGDVVYYARSYNDGTRVYRSADAGQTWTAQENFTGGGGNHEPCRELMVPFDGNSDGSIVYAPGCDTNGEGPWKSVDSGDTFTRKLGLSNANIGGYIFTAYHAYVQDGDLITIVEHGATGHDGLRQSDDGGDTWAIIAGPGDPDGGDSSDIVAFGGFPNDAQQFYTIVVGSAGTVGIYVTTDNGANWTDKTGDFPTAATFEANGGVIVPLWTE